MSRQDRVLLWVLRRLIASLEREGKRWQGWA